ncbi:glycerol-3-phosphate acyltransferase 3 isoform X1 [Frankliniella occidentalis]|uniref:Glycerol-3-phosphate acyltransferase 3 isoform X1 n=1 Tax=Frankliniella occidentalis TaxID=133901 RepID=A0A9C6XUU5_FRAOC|nr:glycerol-3-phosphate acyltransferase 3 isoform X1 [Frankliniella occidentalis]
MALLWTILSVSASLLLTPCLMFLVGLMFLASMGKSLGVRRLYVKFLLKIFEYGRENIEISKRQSQIKDDYEPKGTEECKTLANGNAKPVSDSPQDPVCENSCRQDGVLVNSSHVISHDLILQPDPEQNFNGIQNDTDKAKEELQRKSSYDTIKRDFELSDCFEFVRAGVEAIIEDQVTSRFEAEELRVCSWNLLTRTNRRYEFISWRLTVIWMGGFLLRYCFLFPLRVTICFFGLLWTLVATFLVGFVPQSSFKRILNNWVMLTSFRILARSLSSVLTYHNVELMPKTGGVCVANHTTPIDVVILSTMTTFSLVMWLTFCTSIVGYIPEGKFKRWLNHRVSIMCFGVLSNALSAVITYHNVENRPQHGICVANHTSPIDVLVLACDNCYSLIGQRHGGFLGILQRALARASPHIWFERGEVKDRTAVTQRLKKHVSDPNNPPILIFPEGTCINNTSVMQFKKGSFEVNGAIYPVAIKYDPRFGDAFWNSSRYSMMQYLYMMMTSWAIVCDVWYLPPVIREEGESSVSFASRVKRVIAKQGGLVDLMWDGQLKRTKPKPEWKERQQEEFSKRLKVE